MRSSTTSLNSARSSRSSRSSSPALIRNSPKVSSSSSSSRNSSSSSSSRNTSTTKSRTASSTDNLSYSLVSKISSRKAVYDRIWQPPLSCQQHFPLELKNSDYYHKIVGLLSHFVRSTLIPLVEKNTIDCSDMPTSTLKSIVNFAHSLIPYSVTLPDDKRVKVVNALAKICLSGGSSIISFIETLQGDYSIYLTLYTPHYRLYNTLYNTLYATSIFQSIQ